MQSQCPGPAAVHDRGREEVGVACGHTPDPASADAAAGQINAIRIDVIVRAHVANDLENIQFSQSFDSPSLAINSDMRQRIFGLSRCFVPERSGMHFESILPFRIVGFGHVEDVDLTRLIQARNISGVEISSLLGETVAGRIEFLQGSTESPAHILRRANMLFEQFQEFGLVALAEVFVHQAPCHHHRPLTHLFGPNPLSFDHLANFPPTVE